MDVFDLILEAVGNSIEAGAGNIQILAESGDGESRVSVTDDGNAQIPDDPFAPGCTTKGNGRGLGLAKVKSGSSGRCSLIRENGKTTLSFIADQEIMKEMLDDSLLSVFLAPADISLTLKMSGKSFTLSTGELRERDAIPDRAGAIGRFREMARLKEGEIYG